jgi:hypothetical protein
MSNSRLSGDARGKVTLLLPCANCEWYAKHCVAVMDDMGNVSDYHSWAAERRLLLLRIRELETKLKEVEVKK